MNGGGVMSGHIGDFVTVRVGGMWREGERVCEKDGLVKVRFPFNCCRFGLNWDWFALCDVKVSEC